VTLRLGVRDAPLAGLDHRRLVLLIDQLVTVRAAIGGGLRAVRLPFDVGPLQLMERAALGAQNLENPLIGFGVAAQHDRGVLEFGRRADDDLAVREAQGPALGEQHRVALRGELHAVGLVDEQHARRVAAQIAWRAARNDLQRAAGEAAVQQRVTVGFIGLAGREQPG
jgi:hypothetical protein